MSEKSEDQKKYKRSPALTASIILVFLSIVLLLTLAMFTSFDEVTNRLEAGKVDIVLEEHHWNPQNGDEIVPNTFVEKDPTVRNKEETVNTYVFLEVIVPYDDDPHLIIEEAYQNDPQQAGKNIFNTSGEKVPYYKFVATGEPIGADHYKSCPPNDLRAYYDNNYTNVQKVNSCWKLLTGYPKGDTQRKTWTYVYAYVQENSKLLQPLIANATIQTPLFNEIYLLNFRERKVSTAFPDPERDYSIKINAYGIQAEFLKQNNLTTEVPEEVWAMLDEDYTSVPSP